MAFAPLLTYSLPSTYFPTAYLPYSGRPRGVPLRRAPHCRARWRDGARGRAGAVLRAVLRLRRRRPEKHAAGWRCPGRWPKWWPRRTLCGARDVARQPLLERMGQHHLQHRRIARRRSRRPEPAPQPFQPQPALEPELEHGQPAAGRGDGAGASTGGAGTTHPSGRHTPPCLSADDLSRQRTARASQAPHLPLQ